MSKFTDEVNSTLVDNGFNPYVDPSLYWLEDIDDDGFIRAYYELESNDRFYTVAIVSKEWIREALALESTANIKHYINDTYPLPEYATIDVTDQSVTITDSRSQDVIFTNGMVHNKFESENFLIYVIED